MNEREAIVRYAQAAEAMDTNLVVKVSPELYAELEGGCQVALIHPWLSYGEMLDDDYQMCMHHGSLMVVTGGGALLVKLEVADE